MEPNAKITTENIAISAHSEPEAYNKCPHTRLLTLPQIDLVTGREKLADQEERLERRRKANSKKEEELKNREADLQAV